MEIMDPAYEFNAPRFYDFRRDDEGTSCASRWFDAQDDEQGVVSMRSPLAEVQANVNQASSKKSTRKVAEEAAQQAETAAAGMSKANGGIVGMINNIVTSWGGLKAAASKPSAGATEASVRATWKVPKPTAAGQENQPQQQPHLQSQPSWQQQQPALQGSACKPSAAKAPASASKAPATAPRAAPAAVAAAKPAASHPGWPSAKPSHQQECASSHDHKAAACNAHAPGQAVPLSAAALATPRRRSSVGARGKPGAPADPQVPGKKASSLRLAAQICKRVASSRGRAHARAAASAAQMAEATGTTLMAGARMGRAGAGAKGKAAGIAVRTAAAVKLKRVLRPHKVLPAVSTKPLTLPDDVELRTAKRARLHCHSDEGHGSGTPFKAPVVKVEEVFKKTPARFRSKPAPLPPSQPLYMTEAKSPHLLTSVRARPSNLLSAEERERQELEAMPKFHALKLNTSALMGSGRIERPAERVRPITEPQPFAFVTDDRAERRRKHQGGEEDEGPVAPVFRAQPLDRSMLEGPVGLPLRPRRSSVTVPKSPMLHTKLRAKELASLGKVDIQSHEFHARPVPQYLSVPKEFHAPVPREQPAPTQPAPFHLRTERRGKHYERAMQARLEDEERAAREARIPRAQLLPLSTDVPMVPPRPEPRGLTIPRPFRLRSETRHHEFLDAKTREQLEAEAARRAEAEFKARPLPPLDRVFQVHDSEAPLTVPVDPHLTTESRAAERAAFDHAVEEKMRLMEEQRRLEEAARQAEEERAVKRMRKSMVVHARPVPDFTRPFMAMPSERALTNPVTPKLGRKGGGKRSRDEAAEA